MSLQLQGCLHLLKKDMFVQLVKFLLGPPPRTIVTSTSRGRSCHDDGALTRCGSLGPSTRLSLSSSAARTSPYLSLRLTPMIQFLLIRTWCLPRGQTYIVMHQALFTIDNSKRFIREVGVVICAMMYMYNVLKGHLTA